MRCESHATTAHTERDPARAKETLVHKGLDQQRLLALFFAGALLLNFPLLALWDRDATVFGLPLFPAALFVLWAGLIALVAWFMESIDD